MTNCTYCPEENCTNFTTITVTTTCVSTLYVNCLPRAEKVFKIAESLHHTWPECLLQMASPWVDAIQESHQEDYAFSFMTGELNYVSGGTVTYINVSGGTEGWDRSIGQINKAWSNLDIRAYMWTILVYSPVLHGLSIIQMLAELNLSGDVLTSLQVNSIDLSTTPQGWQPWEQSVVIALSCVVLFLELRRIYFPKYPEEQDRRTGWTLVFGFLPVLFLTCFIVRFLRGAGDHAGYARLIQHTATAQDSFSYNLKDIAQMYDLLSFDYYIRMMDMLGVILMCALFFKYLLLYFPQLTFLQNMVRKVLRPTGAALLIFVMAYFVFGAWFYMMFNDSVYQFHGPITTFMSMVMYAQGGFKAWQEISLIYPLLWTFISICTFCTFVLILNNILVSVLVSHVKEMRLRENYSYHPNWSGVIGAPNEFNPATAGAAFEWKKAGKSN